jgi:hypothetical protein
VENPEFKEAEDMKRLMKGGRKRSGSGSLVEVEAEGARRATVGALGMDG